MATPGGSTPAVSVVVPVHNRREMLCAALSGVAAQRQAPPYEVLVVDDHSDDGSATAAEQWGATVVRHSANRGPGAARNSGIELARGEWVAFLDSDDTWHPYHLATLWAKRHDVSLVAASSLTVDSTTMRVVGSPFLRIVEVTRPDDILRPRNIVATSGCMVRRAALLVSGGFPEVRLSEDLELWLRILGRHRGRILPNLTVVSRVHDAQSSAVHRTEMERRTAEVANVAAAEGSLLPATAARLIASGHWDILRATSTGPVELLKFSTSGHVGLVVQLLWRRTQQRHRWRLYPARVSQLRALTAFPPEGVAAPAAPRRSAQR